MEIQNFGDGSGKYSDGTVTIQNFGDGSGNYESDTITIQNFGDGTALVDDEMVDADPLPPVPELGVFPPLGAEVGGAAGFAVGVAVRVAAVAPARGEGAGGDQECGCARDSPSW